MPDEVSVSGDGLAAIAHHLRDGGSRLESAASSVPDPPDAGACTDGVAAVLAWFADSASRLVAGSVATGDAVTESARTYDRTDSGNAESLRSLGSRGGQRTWH